MNAKCAWFQYEVGVVQNFSRAAFLCAPPQPSTSSYAYVYDKQSNSVCKMVKVYMCILPKFTCTYNHIVLFWGYTGIVLPNGPKYSLTLSTASYSAGNYSIIFYFTDVYGQSSQERLFLHLRGIQV